MKLSVKYEKLAYSIGKSVETRVRLAICFQRYFPEDNVGTSKQVVLRVM